MNNINCVLEEKANCVGCRACLNICPSNAIIMKEDEEGFFYPVVDSEKCTNCGLCKKACPSLNKSEVYNENTLKVLFKYCFLQSPLEKEILHTYANKNNYKERELGLKVNTKIENWVQEIYNSDLFITNSYHGVCFALIFNKNFICFSNKEIGKNRIEDLLKKVGLEDRLYNNILDKNTLNECLVPIDWEKVNSILEREKECSLKWLKNALETPKDLSKINPADAMIKDLNSKIINLQASLNNSISIEGMHNVLNYKKNYRRYLKYKILKNFVFGKKRDRYKEKQKIYHEKIKSARRIKRGIAGV